MARKTDVGQETNKRERKGKRGRRQELVVWKQSHNLTSTALLSLVISGYLLQKILMIYNVKLNVKP